MQDNYEYNVGTVSITVHKEIYEVQWKINGYFYRKPNPGDIWKSPAFKIWDKQWFFSLFPNGGNGTLFPLISLELKSDIIRAIPRVSFKSGIKRGDGSVYMSTDPAITTQTCFSSKQILERSRLINDRHTLTSPEGNVEFFVTFRLMNEGEENTTPQLLSKSNESKVIEEDKGGENSSHDDVSLFHRNDIDVLTQNIEDLFLKQQLCDVTIRVDEREFQAHKFILAARSPVFASMFEHDMKEKKSGIINIDDSDPGAFDNFLRYLYTAKLDIISPENVTALYSIADKYDVQQLTWRCDEFMLENFSVENFCDVIALAVQHKKSDLIKAAEMFFAKNMEKILVTVKWQSFLKENCIVANELFIKSAKLLKEWL